MLLNYRWFCTENGSRRRAVNVQCCNETHWSFGHSHLHQL